MSDNTNPSDTKRQKAHPSYPLSRSAKTYNSEGLAGYTIDETGRRPCLDFGSLNREFVEMGITDNHFWVGMTDKGSFICSSYSLSGVMQSIEYNVKDGSYKRGSLSKSNNYLNYLQNNHPALLDQAQRADDNDDAKSFNSQAETLLENSTPTPEKAPTYDDKGARKNKGHLAHNIEETQLDKFAKEKLGSRSITQRWSLTDSTTYDNLPMIPVHGRA